jgi:hypothetical protein
VTIKKATGGMKPKGAIYFELLFGEKLVGGAFMRKEWISLLKAPRKILLAKSLRI